MHSPACSPVKFHMNRNQIYKTTTPDALPVTFVLLVKNLS